MQNCRNQIVWYVYTDIESSQARARLLHESEAQRCVQLQHNGCDYMLNTDVLNTYTEIGYKACEQGHYEVADQMFLAAIKEAQAAGEKDLRLGATLINIAATYIERRLYRKAESLYKQALALYNYVLGPNNWHCSMVLVNLAELCCLQGKFGQSVQFYKRALTAAEKSSARNLAELIHWHRRLAWIYMKQKKFADADQTYRRMLQLEQSVTSELA